MSQQNKLTSGRLPVVERKSVGKALMAVMQIIVQRVVFLHLKRYTCNATIKSITAITEMTELWPLAHPLGVRPALSLHIWSSGLTLWAALFITQFSKPLISVTFPNVSKQTNNSLNDSLDHL